MKKNIIRQIRRVGIPRCIMRWIDNVNYLIDKFILSSAGDIPQNATVLDAGAGESPYKKYFKHCTYVTIDTQCGDSEWDYSQLDSIGDLEKIPYKDNSFDAVICTQVLEHVKEPLVVVKELYRILKPIGTLYLSAPQGWGIHQAPHDYFRFTHFGLKHLLTSAGFNVRSITPACGYFSYLANRLTIVPKVLFWQIKRLWLRIILFPIELIFYVLFVVLFPIMLNAIDFLDTQRNYTLLYFSKSTK